MNEELATINDEDGTVYLPRSSNVTVAGTSVLPSGTELSVEIRANDSAGPFVLERRAVVTSDSTWEATFDLSDGPSHTEVTVAVRYDGEIQDSAEGVIETPRASITFEDQVVREGEANVTVQSATLEEGGFVAVYLDPNGPIVGVSEYLPPGTHENVTIDHWDDPVLEENATLFAVAHMDTTGDRRWWFEAADEDHPYVSEGEHVSDTATVVAVVPTPTPTTPSPSPTQTPELTPTPTDVEGPGFGPVVGLLAAGVAVVVAARAA